MPNDLQINSAIRYAVNDLKLSYSESEAATVRMIFERFFAVGSATTLARTLAAEWV